MIRLAVLMIFLTNIAFADEPGAVVKAQVDTSSAYINAQIILNVELKISGPLRNGSLSKPEIKDAIVETLVEDDQREIEENDVTKQVFTRSYAVFPTKTGVITIPPFNFEGILISDNGGFFPGFFSSGKRIKTRSEALKITVKDVPADFPPGHNFLPVKSLTITDAFSEPGGTFAINKASTRRFEIKALGALPSIVPTLNPVQVPGMQIYGEAGQRLQNISDKGLMVDVSFSHVYLPVKSGPIHIPEQTIYWWDANADQLKTTVVKALDIVVEGSPAPVAPIADAEEKIAKEPAEMPVKPRASNLLWPILAGSFLFLWLLTLAWHLYRIKRLRAMPKPEESGTPDRGQHLIEDLKKACHQGSAKDALRLLIALNEMPEPLSLELSTCLMSLEHALYHTSNHANPDEVLKQITKALPAWTRSKPKEVTLKPLYPQ